MQEQAQIIQDTVPGDTQLNGHKQTWPFLNVHQRGQTDINPFIPPPKKSV